MCLQCSHWEGQCQFVAPNHLPNRQNSKYTTWGGGQGDTKLSIDGPKRLYFLVGLPCSLHGLIFGQGWPGRQDNQQILQKGNQPWGCIWTLVLREGGSYCVFSTTWDHIIFGDPIWGLCSPELRFQSCKPTTLNCQGFASIPTLHCAFPSPSVSLPTEWS